LLASFDVGKNLGKLSATQQALEAVDDATSLSLGRLAQYKDIAEPSARSGRLLAHAPFSFIRRTPWASSSSSY
jgi:hypothetical protein